MLAPQATHEDPSPTQTASVDSNEHAKAPKALAPPESAQGAAGDAMHASTEAVHSGGLGVAGASASGGAELGAEASHSEERLEEPQVIPLGMTEHTVGDEEAAKIPEMSNEREEEPAVLPEMSNEREEEPAVLPEMSNEREEEPAVLPEMSNEREEEPAVLPEMSNEREEEPAVLPEMSNEREEEPADTLMGSGEAEASAVAEMHEVSEERQEEPPGGGVRPAARSDAMQSEAASLPSEDAWVPFKQVEVELQDTGFLKARYRLHFQGQQHPANAGALPSSFTFDFDEDAECALVLEVFTPDGKLAGSAEQSCGAVATEGRVELCLPYALHPRWQAALGYPPQAVFHCVLTLRDAPHGTVRHVPLRRPTMESLDPITAVSPPSMAMRAKASAQVTAQAPAADHQPVVDDYQMDAMQGDFSRPLGLELYHNPYNDEEESAREALEHDEAVVRDRVLAPWAVGIMGLERLWRGVEELEAMEQEERELVADEARRETEEEYAAFQAFLGSLQDSRVEVLQWYQEIARVIVAEEFRAFKELVMYIGALIAERKKLDRAHDQSRKLIEQQILPHWHQTIGDAHSWNTVLAMMRLEIREEEVRLCVEEHEARDRAAKFTWDVPESVRFIGLSKIANNVQTALSSLGALEPELFTPAPAAASVADPGFGPRNSDTPPGPRLPPVPIPGKVRQSIPDSPAKYPGHHRLRNASIGQVPAWVPGSIPRAPPQPPTQSHWELHPGPGLEPAARRATAALPAWKPLKSPRYNSSLVGIQANLYANLIDFNEVEASGGATGHTPRTAAAAPAAQSPYKLAVPTPPHALGKSAKSFNASRSPRTQRRAPRRSITQ